MSECNHTCNHTCDRGDCGAGPDRYRVTQPHTMGVVEVGGAPAKPDNRRRAPAGVARAAMGIDWMSRDELSQAIPPAYTEFIGRQLRRAMG